MRTRSTIFTLLLSLIFSVCLAQADSIVVVNTKWTIKKIAKGIYLKQNSFDQSLFHSNQNISILEVKLGAKNWLDIAAEPQQRKITSTFGKTNEAIAAINGTFFDMKNGGSVDYIRLDGQMLNSNRLSKNGNRALHQKAAIVIDKKQVRIVEWDGTPDWEEHLKGEDIMVTGPLLVKDKQLEKLDTTAMYVMRHPRSALAIKGNKLLLVTVDGRNQRAAGMSLFELASLLKWIGAEDGINLDGGGSTTLWVKGEPEGGVINYPSDNKKMVKKASTLGVDPDNLPADTQRWDHTGERPVANVIVVRNSKSDSYRIKIKK